MNYLKTQDNDNGFKVPQIYWEFTSKKVLTLR